MNYGNEGEKKKEFDNEKKKREAAERVRKHKEKRLIETLKKNIEKMEKPALFNYGDEVTINNQNFTVARVKDRVLILKYV